MGEESTPPEALYSAYKKCDFSTKVLNIHISFFIGTIVLVFLNQIKTFGRYLFSMSDLSYEVAELL